MRSAYMLPLRTAAVICMSLAAGCVSQERDSSRQDTVVGGMSNDRILATFDTVPSTGPKPGDSVNGARQLQFTQAAVKERLRAVGLDPVDEGVVSQPFLGTAGRIYRVRGGDIQAYIYGDAIALARDVGKLDTLRVAPPTMMVEWRMPPSLIVANNLAVILLTRDEKLRERVHSAFKPY